MLFQTNWNYFSFQILNVHSSDSSELMKMHMNGGAWNVNCSTCNELYLSVHMFHLSKLTWSHTFLRSPRFIWAFNLNLAVSGSCTLSTQIPMNIADSLTPFSFNPICTTTPTMKTPDKAASALNMEALPRNMTKTSRNGPPGPMGPHPLQRMLRTHLANRPQILQAYLQ